MKRISYYIFYKINYYIPIHKEDEEKNKEKLDTHDGSQIGDRLNALLKEDIIKKLIE